MHEPYSTSSVQALTTILRKTYYATKLEPYYRTTETTKQWRHPVAEEYH